jgi:thioredoxin 1
MIKAFTATWCGPCRMIKPQLQNIINEGQIKIELYDIDSNVEITKEFGIKSVPTLIYFNEEGTEVGRLSGFKPAAEIIREYEALV